LYLFISPGYCCSIICDLPSKLDKNTFIGEGRIIGYKGNYSHSDVSGGYGLVEIAITKMLYPDKIISKLYISQFGLGSSCEQIGYSKETLMELYPLDKIVSFVGKKMNFLGDSILQIGICECCPVVLGSMDDRLDFDYESQRKEVTLQEQLLEEFQLIIGFTHWELREDMLKASRTAREIANKIYIPEKLQVYIDLVEINQSKTKEGRFYILRQLIWSSYLNDPKFIEKQRISRRQKSILLEEFARIKENWPLN